MNDDPSARPGRTSVAKKRDITALKEQRGMEISTPGTATTAQHRPVAPPQPEDMSLTARHGDEGIINPRFNLRLGLPRVALPQLKVSALLVSFVACVLVPAFAATIYLTFIASNQLAAEARFAVRQIEFDSNETASNAPSTSNGTNDSGGASTNFSFTAPGQNAYIVTSYIRSRAIVDDLNAMLNLREIFRRPEADFWARLKRNASIDELTEYWNLMVNTYIDAPSGIVTLRVRAFRADDAVSLSEAVLQLSENLVNRISDRARRDAMEMSEKEVRRTYEMTQVALADMHRFRDSAGIIDPVQAGTEIGKLLIPLLTEKIRLESDLFVASRDLDDSAPTIKALKSRLDTTEHQIADLKGRLTDTDAKGNGKTVAASLAKFEELDLQRQFAEKLYTLAQADLDRARLRAARQSVYLTVFVPPSSPEESRYPRRMAYSILIFLGFAVIWAIGAMTFASVEDHRL